MKIDWKRKLSSRKFWAAFAAWATSVLTALNVAGDTIALVTTIISGAGALIVYVLAEAYIDGKGMSATAAPVIDNDTPADVLVSDFVPPPSATEDRL